MAEFNFDNESKFAERYIAMIFEHKPIIASKESEIEIVKNRIIGY